MSSIQWTDETWNPVVGCTHVSRGCDHCYAALWSTRLAGNPKTPQYKRLSVLQPDGTARFSGKVTLVPHKLEQPLSWKRPRKVFVNSMSDLFHQNIRLDYLRQIFAVMLHADQHWYQILTKRPRRAVGFWQKNADLWGGGTSPAHIWVGTSIEDQQVSYRARHLYGIDAAVRFLSLEPLLGPVDLDYRGYHWVIVGGESGPRHRPLDLDWVRQIRSGCQRAGVAFFYKQGAGRRPGMHRELDGRLWEEYPDMAPHIVQPSLL